MLVRGGPYLLWGEAGRIYDFIKKSYFFHCFEDCERRRVSVALGFWEACGGHVCRRTLRAFGLISNINGDRVWFYRAHLGIYALCTVGNCTSVFFVKMGFSMFFAVLSGFWAYVTRDIYV